MSTVPQCNRSILTKPLFLTQSCGVICTILTWALVTNIPSEIKFSAGFCQNDEELKVGESLE